MLQIVSPSERVKTVGLAHTAATTAKTPAVINAHAFIPLNTADADARNAFVYDAEIDAAPAETGVAWAVGDKIYWDATNGVFTKTTTSNTLAGYVLEAKLAAAAVSGLIAFNSFAV